MLKAFGAMALLWVALAASASGQPLLVTDPLDLRAVGWSGFLDTRFFLETLVALSLAIGLGAVIAFHPITPRTVDTLQEAEMPKVYILYALIGAMVGVTVVEYGMVVGFVVFGLGGLMRFRTDTESTRDTGRLIIVTLLGLISGLHLPHLAILSAAFAFGLIYLFRLSSDLPRRGEANSHRESRPRRRRLSRCADGRGVQDPQREEIVCEGPP